MASRLKNPSVLRDDDVAALQSRIARLEKINAALIDRVERSTDIQGGAFSMFETAITLEAMVRGRTTELEDALSQLNVANAELEAAHRDVDFARARLRDAIETLADGFALFDAEDRLVMCNRAFFKFWPELEEMASANPRFAEMVDCLARSGRALSSLVSSERWARQRLTQHRAAGTHVQALSDGRWLQITEQRTSEGGTVGIYTDITSVKVEDARERARELAERNLALQSTLDTLSEGACLFDARQRLQAWNEVLANMLGLDRDVEVRIATHADFAGLCGELGLDRPQAVEWREGRAPRISTECMIGKRHFVVRSVTLATGGMAFAFDDVTDSMRFQRSMTETAETLERAVEQRTSELVEVNRQLGEAKEQAEEANRSKTRFIAAASHDLLQPLNAARLFVSALAERRLADRSRGLVGQASVALESVEGLLEALFEISRLDAGAIAPEITAIELDRIFSALRIEYAPSAEARGLAFEVGEPGLWVGSDSRMLRRILQNLVSNAIRYTASGSVSLIAQSEGEAVRIIIRDTGPGIAEEKRDEIFEEFRRLGTSPRDSGYGLGLAIVRRYCLALGIEIEIASQLGAGSSFSILVPLAQPNAQREPRVEHRHGRASRADGPVIVIDNDASILDGMRALLEGWGLEVVTATMPDAPEVEAALGRGASVLIADYHLDDGLTGDVLVEQFQAQRQAHLPALIISADRSEPVKAELAQRNLPLLTKPVKPAQLRALLRQFGVMS